jgi:hypothetical protein
MRRHRLSVLVAVGAGLALCPGAVATTDPAGHRTTSEARATTGSTSVTFRVLPSPTITPTPDPSSSSDGSGEEGPAALAGSGNAMSVALDVDNGGQGGSVSSGREHNGGHSAGRHGHTRTAAHGRPITGTRHRAAGRMPRRGRLPFTGGDIGSTVLAGVAALLAGSVAVCLAAVTRGRRRALRSG